MTSQIRVLDASRSEIGESPLWSDDEQCLYWVDINGRALHRFDWRTAWSRQYAIPERIGSIALHASGGLVAALESGIHHLRLEDDGVACLLLAPAIFREPNIRFNDGRCDRSGRFWVTSISMDMNRGHPCGCLWRFDHRGLVQMLDGLFIGNGLAFSPGGETLYLADTHVDVQRVWAFDLDSAANLSNRREFIDMRSFPGRPDGATVDRTGGYWVCGNGGHVVMRFRPDGAPDRTIELPMEQPTMCCLGGPDGRHMFITSMKPCKTHPQALDGATLMLQPRVHAIAEAKFYLPNVNASETTQGVFNHVKASRQTYEKPF